MGFAIRFWGSRCAPQRDVRRHGCRTTATLRLVGVVVGLSMVHRYQSRDTGQYLFIIIGRLAY